MEGCWAPQSLLGGALPHSFGILDLQVKMNCDCVEAIIAFWLYFYSITLINLESVS